MKLRVEVSLQMIREEMSCKNTLHSGCPVGVLSSYFLQYLMPAKLVNKLVNLNLIIQSTSEENSLYCEI